MIRFISGRLVRAIIILLCIAVFNFLLIHMAPGDPAAVMAGEAGDTDPIFLQQLRERFGLDQPLYVQLWIYISSIVQLDLGFSYRQSLPVVDLIGDRLPATLLLSLSAFVISLGLGVLGGAIASARQGKIRGEQERISPWKLKKERRRSRVRDFFFFFFFFLNFKKCLI